MDVKGLTPEERAALKAALDEAEQPDPMDQMAETMNGLCEKVEELGEELMKLKALVLDDLVGGIKEAFDSNVRTERMGDFKGKYGAELDPLAEPFKKTFGADLHEKAFDYMDSLRGEEGYTDEVGDTRLKEVIAQIKEKLGLNEPEPAVAEVTATEVPAPEPAAEVGEAEEEPEADAQQAWDEIAQMKKRDDARAAQREKKPVRKGA